MAETLESKSDSRLRVRGAVRGDAATVLSLIRELAEYERLLDHVTATEADIDRLLFAPDARAFCDLAEWDGVPVGFAFWCYNVSTFRGRHGIYLEDLYVQPGLRGHGIGKACGAVACFDSAPRVATPTAAE